MAEEIGDVTIEEMTSKESYIGRGLFFQYTID